MDMRQINQILGPANAAISRELQFIRSIQGGGQTAFRNPSPPPQQQAPPWYGAGWGSFNPPPAFGSGPFPGYFSDGFGFMPPPPPSLPSMPYPPYNFIVPPRGGRPPQQAGMDQFMGFLFSLLAANGSGGNGNNILKALFGDFFDSGNTNDTNPDNDDTDTDNDSDDDDDQNSTSIKGREAASNLLQKVLRRQDDEESVSDPDDDDVVVSIKDIDRLKDALDDDKFTEADLRFAFQTQLLKVSTGRVNELLELFSLSIDADLVKPTDLLNRPLIEQLSTTRSNQLAKQIAAEGLADDDGNPDTKLIRFLTNAIDPEAPTKVRRFGRNVVKELVAKWIIEPVASPNADKDNLISFLRLNGFKFNNDGTLRPDAEQPFAIGISAPAPSPA